MNLTKKQQIQIIAISLALIILIWQLKAMYSESAAPLSATTKTAVTPDKMALNKPVSHLPPVDQAQSEYLRLVNEYQTIQMQRMIAEGYEAIAIARRNTAKALSETVLITGSSANMPGSETSRSNGDFELIYTGQEGGLWAATLKKGNQTFDVVLGTVIGNMHVTKIDDSSVTVKQGDKTRVINFSDVYPVVMDGAVAPSKINADRSAVKPAAALPIAPFKPVTHTKVAVVTIPVAPVTKIVATEPAKAVVPAPAAKVVVATMPPIPAVVVKPEPAKAVVLAPAAKVVAATMPPIPAAVVVKLEPAKVADVEIEKPVTSLSLVLHKPFQPTVHNMVASTPDKVGENKDLQKLAVVMGKTEAAPAVVKVAPDKISPSKVAVVEVAKNAEVGDSAKILATAANHYTIQLMADANLPALKLFAKRHHIEDNALFFKTQKAGKSWYVLIYGDYPNYIAANTAMNKFSDSLQQWDPFIRKMASIQIAIKDAK